MQPRKQLKPQQPLQLRPQQHRSYVVSPCPATNMPMSPGKIFTKKRANRPKSPEPLCSVCDRFLDSLIRDNKDWSHGTGSMPLHKKAKSFKASVAKGCRICNFLKPHLGANTYPQNVSWFLPKPFYDDQYEHGMNKIIWTLSIEKVSFDLSIRSNSVEARKFLDKHDAVRISHEAYDKVEHSGSQPCIDLIKHWITTCEKQHEKQCSRYRVKEYHGDWMPTRLVYCPRNEAPRLCLKEQGLKRQRYMTLSHCWGTIDHRLQLTKDKLDLWTQALPADELSRMKTFHDAIQVAQGCGIQYLWIDSLCIIQDDYDDWAKESALMDPVYRYSTCNISATDAEDDSIGCFFPRGRPYITFQTDIRPAHKRTDAEPILWPIHIYRTKDHQEMRKGVAHSRGWVVQERILSPRIVHFCRNQLFWECDSLTASERLPAGEDEGTGEDDKDQKVVGRERIKIFQKGVQEIPGNNYAISLPEPLHRWIGVRNLYWKTRITHRGDALIAVSAIARELRRTMPRRYFDYFAGIFEAEEDAHIMYQLCWTSGAARDDSGEEYVAPSWSWASVIGAANLDEDDGTFSKAIAVATFDQSHRKFVDDDEYGRVAQGSAIELQGVRGPVRFDAEDSVSVILGENHYQGSSLKERKEEEKLNQKNYEGTKSEIESPGVETRQTEISIMEKERRKKRDEDKTNDDKSESEVQEGKGKGGRISWKGQTDEHEVETAHRSVLWEGLRIKWDVLRPLDRSYYFVPLLFTGKEASHGYKRANAIYFLRGLALEMLPTGNFRRVGLIQGNVDVTRGSLFRELVGRQDGYAAVAVEPWEYLWDPIIIE